MACRRAGNVSRIGYGLNCADSVIAPLALRRQIKKPSIRGPSGVIFMQNPPQLHEATKPNLEKELHELVSDGDVLEITDRSLPFTLSLRIEFA